jgi:hypothetical protein
MSELFGESMAMHGLRADKYLALHVCHLAGGAARCFLVRLFCCLSVGRSDVYVVNHAVW